MEYYIANKHSTPAPTYADVFLDPAPGEHPVQLRSETLLRKQGEDDGIGDDHLRILQYDLSVDSQHHLAYLALLRAHFLADRAAVEEVAQSTTATEQRGIVQEDGGGWPGPVPARYVRHSRMCPQLDMSDKKRNICPTKLDVSDKK